MKFVAVAGVLPVDTTELNLSVVPASSTLSPLENGRVLDLYLENNATNTPKSDVTIIAKFLNPNNGTLDKYTAITDVNGHVAFNYTKPETVTIGDEVSVTFEVLNGSPKRTVSAKIKFVDNNDSPAVVTTNYALTLIPTEITISTDDTSKVFDVYLENSVTHIPVSNQMINAQFFNPNKGTLDIYAIATDANGHVAFNYTRPDVVNVGDEFNITFEIPNASEKREINGTVKFVNALISPEINRTTYELIAVPKNIDISVSGSTKILDLYLNDTLTNTPVGNQVIIAEFINPNKGTLDKYTATTDDNGHVIFSYTSPALLPTNDLNITFKILGGTASQDENVTVSFVSPSTIDYTNYTFRVTPLETNISVGGESIVIEAFIGNNALPVSGEVVLVDFTSLTEGRMSSFSAITDDNGHVAFNYTADAEITALIGTDVIISLRMENNRSKEANTTIHFVSPSTLLPIDTTNYNLSAVPHEINVSTPSTQRVLDLYLEDNSTHRPIAEKNILARFFSPTTGTLNQYQGTTDANGHVSFSYISPTELPTSDLTLTFEVENASVPRVATVLVHFVETPTLDTSSYQVTAIPNKIGIITAGEKVALRLYVSDTTTQKPISNLTMIAHFFNPTQGTLDKYTATTDTNGRVAFEYEAPSDLNVSDVNITFAIEGGTHPQETDVSVHFYTGVTAYSLANVSTPIVVTQDSQVSDILVYVVDGDNIGVSGKTVSISLIEDGFGSVESATATTDSSGKALFTYTAPQNLTTVPRASTVATLSFIDNGVVLTKDVNITIAPLASGSDYNFTNVKTPINIYQSEQTVVIDLQLVKNNIPVISTQACSSIGTVTTDCIMTESIPRGFGRIVNVGTSTREDGYIYFNLLSASSEELLGDGNSTTMNIHYIDANGNIAASAVVEININVLPTVDTSNYQLTAVPKEFNIDPSNVGRVIDLYLNDTVTHSPIANQVILAQFINPNSGTLDKYTTTTDANGYVSFNYIAPDTLPVLSPSSDLNITFQIAGATDTKDENVTVHFVALNTPPSVDSVNFLVIAEPKTIYISPTDTKRVLDVYVQNTSTNAPVINQAVIARFVKPINGTLSQYTIYTDDSGHVAFNYTAPTDRNNGDFNITFAIPNATYAKETNLTIKFVENNVSFDVNSTNFELIAEPTTVHIYPDDTERAVDLYLKNIVTKAPVVNQPIVAYFVHPTNGTLSQYTVLTDASGHVAFNYIAPESRQGADFNITFAVPNANNAHETNVTITFEDSNISAFYVDSSNFVLTSQPKTIYISPTDTKRVVDVYLENTLKKAPVIGQPIVAQFISPSNGTLSQYTVVSDASGHAAFNYTAPTNRPSNGEFNITFTIPNASDVVESNTTIKFVENNVSFDVNSTNFELMAEPKTVHIYPDDTERAIDLYLKNTVTKAPVVNQPIVAYFVTPSNGTLSEYTVLTDASGHVAFNYVAPESRGADFNITFAVPNANNAHETNVTIAFEDSNVSAFEVNSSTFVLTSEPKTIFISPTDTTRVVDVYLEDTSDNSPVIGQPIIAYFITPSNGKLSQYTVITDASGHVAFNYTAPIDRQKADFNITFAVPNGTDRVESNTTIKFVETDISSDVDTTNLELFVVPASSTLSTLDTGRALDLYVENMLTNTPKSDVTIIAKFLNPNDGTLDKYTAITDVNGHVSFNYIKPETVTVGNEIKVTFAILNGTPTTKEVNATIQFVDAHTVDTTDYNLTAEPKTININSEDTGRVLDLYLENNRTHAPIADAVIIAKFINPKEGTLSSYSQTTDENGHVSFNYTPPATIDENTQMNITFGVSGGTVTKETNVTVKFVALDIVPDVNTTNYQLIAVPKDVNISLAGATRVLDLYLEDTTTHVPVSTHVITAQFFNPNSGTLNQYTATTDANGHVVFTYTAPETLPTNDFNITFKMAGGIASQDENVSFHFVSPSTTNYTNYTFSVTPKESNISIGGTTQVIEAFVSLGTSPIAGEVVLVDFTSNTQGKMSSFSATTDDNGHVAFSYTADTDISALIDTNITITLRMENNRSKEANATIKFVALSTVAKIDTTNYHLIAVPNSVKVAPSDTTKTFDLYLENNSTHAPIADTDIIAYFVNPINGTLTSYKETTNDTGHVSFTYNAPQDLATNDFNITFAVDNASLKREANVSVFFVETLVDSTTYSFVVTPSDTNITVAGESRTIVAYISDNDKAISGEVVYVDFTSATQGRMSSFSATTDTNGQVAFRYTSPDDLSELYGTDINITLRMENNSSKSGMAKIHFRNEVLSYTLEAVPTTLNVSVAEERRTIDLYLYDLVTNRVIANQDIIAEYFDANNGTLDDYNITTDDNGHVVFNYTVPSNLTLRTFDIKFVLSATGATAETNVSVNIEANATTSYADYNLSVLSEEINITRTGQTAIIDAYLEDASKNPAVGEVILIDFFNGTKGTMDKFSGIVDELGHIQFTYTSPNSLVGLDGTRIRLSMENNRSQEVFVTINADSAIYEITSEENVTVADGAVALNIQVGLKVTPVGGVSAPAEGKTVVAEYLMPIYGSLASYEAVVGTDGLATFNYILPS